MDEINMQRLETSSLSYRIIDQEDAEQLYRIYPDLPKSHMHGCPSCGKNNGEMVDGIVTLNGVKYRCNCQDQLQRHKHYLNSGIGLTYQLLSWSDYHGDVDALAEVQRYMSQLHERLDSGHGLMLFGSDVGVGKSMLAYLVLKECILGGYKCYATTYSDMLASMKAGWKDAEYSKWYKSRIDSAQVLLLDDVGKEMHGSAGFNNDFAKQTFDGVIRTRVQQGRSTIITTNLDPISMQAAYGHPVWSLMTECMVPVHVKGNDYRASTGMKLKGERRIY